LTWTTTLAAVDLALIVVLIPWILSLKKRTTSALAWCLVVLLLPLLGSLMFVVVGYTYVDRPLRRKRRHRHEFTTTEPSTLQRRTYEALSAEQVRLAGWKGLGRLAAKLGNGPLVEGNEVDVYHEATDAFDAMFAAIESAEHHIHLQFYIIQPDEIGRRLIKCLAERARAGVEVRLLYDAIGSFTLPSRLLLPLVAAGGKCSDFMGINPLRRRFRINLRNHRKIVVVDGQTAFTGGVNIGLEYLGLDPKFGYWRDSHLRLRGPAAAQLQRVFIEDWDFATGQQVQGPEYFPTIDSAGTTIVQIVDSGPDEDINSTRALVLAAIMSAERRIWIASPYIVPDTSVLEALLIAAHWDIDVRLLLPRKPDRRLPRIASRYLWGDLMAAGVRIYEYTRGMMHAKLMVVDDQWGWVGTANLDGRSLALNFENLCVLHSPDAVADLAAAFERDLDDSEEVDAEEFAGRPWSHRAGENVARLFAPLL
jgi:cardiolipin synthase